MDMVHHKVHQHPITAAIMKGRWWDLIISNTIPGNLPYGDDSECLFRIEHIALHSVTSFYFPWS
jgi:hypothetical protein